ncbi:MAG TPA: hypothetical protein ENN21_01240 [Spirochaetes bacterium]|nr:hypothetical protein [Spirochaetota bacterium]
MIKRDFNKIRQAAFRHLHLIYVRRYDGKYIVMDKKSEDVTPVLADYLSIQPGTRLVRMKDTGSSRIYLVDAGRFDATRLDSLLKADPSLEARLREWFPFLWGELSEEDEERYFSILNQLQELADLRVEPE